MLFNIIKLEGLIVTILFISKLSIKLGKRSKYKHTNLLWKFINYDRKMFYNINPCSMCIIHLRIDCKKLVISF